MHGIRTLLYGARERFNENADAWGMTRQRALMIVLFPIVVVGIVTLIAALALLSKGTFRPLFAFLTEEDSLLEWGSSCSSSLPV